MKDPFICYTYCKPTKRELAKHGWAGSIFMAGPTPRSKDVPSWRPQAVETLKYFGFQGIVYYPEYKIDAETAQRKAGKQWFEKQVEWEHDGLDNSDIILMWVPRDLRDMPAFTTNCEFGLYVKDKRLYYGRPGGAPKNEYLDYCYRKFTNREPFNNLMVLTRAVVERINK